MSAVTLVTFDAGGNAPPVLAAARALVARGADVQLLGHERQRAAGESTGARFEALDALAFWDPGVRRPLLSSLAQYSRVAADRRLGREVRERATRHGSRAALVDCMTGSAITALADAGTPTAVVFHTFLDYWELVYARGPIGSVARVRGTDLSKAWASAARRLVTAETALDPASAFRRASAPDAEWVGADGGHMSGVDASARATGAVPDAASAPLVVVSLSTTWLRGQTDVYQRIADALGALPVRAILTLGGLRPDRPLALPGNVEQVDRADHGALFPTASLVVGHGGHATTSTALAHDLPLVLLPTNPYADQPMVAQAVAAAGAGIVLRADARPAVIADAVARALADDGMRAAAATLGRGIRSHDPAGALAAAVLDLAT